MADRLLLPVGVPISNVVVDVVDVVAVFVVAVDVCVVVVVVESVVFDGPNVPVVDGVGREEPS